MIGVVTDSAASIDPILLESRRIRVVPMQLEIDGQPVEEGRLPVEELEQILSRAGEKGAPHVGTSAPAPGAFVEAIREADEGEGVVVLTVSAKMSSTHSAAVLAARMSEARVEVIDTGTAAGAEGLVTLAAYEEAWAGGSLEAVVKQASLASNRVRMVAEVGDLRPLARGGRLPSPLASLGTSLGVRPVFQYRRGSISVLRPALSERAAREALVSAWQSSVPDDLGEGDRLHVTASYGADREAAQALVDQVAGRVRPATAYVARFGPVMVAHTGTDILGLSWWWDSAG